MNHWHWEVSECIIVLLVDLPKFVSFSTGNRGFILTTNLVLERMYRSLFLITIEVPFTNGTYSRSSTASFRSVTDENCIADEGIQCIKVIKYRISILEESVDSFLIRLIDINSFVQIVLTHIVCSHIHPSYFSICYINSLFNPIISNKHTNHYHLQ